MRAFVTSTVIGKLKQDDTFEDWWISARVPVPYLDDKKLTFTFSEFDPARDPRFLGEADQALAHFLRLTAQDRLAVSDLVFRHYLKYNEAAGLQKGDEDYVHIKGPEAVWKFVKPMEVMVSRRPYGEEDVYVQVLCDCKWEEEHGLQLVFRQGRKLTRVSDQDGNLTDADAYDIPDEEDELLSQF